MKKFNKYTSLILVLALVFGFSFANLQNYTLYAEAGSGGGEQQKEKQKTPEEEAREEAEKLGKEYGEMYACRDYMKNLKSNKYRHFGTRKIVYDYFNLSKDDNASDFYSAFIKSYRSTYEVKYVSFSNQDKDKNQFFLYTLAKKQAELEGKAAAYDDFLRGKKYDWEKAYEVFIRDESIADRFYYGRFPEETFKDFELYFKLYFKNSYRKAYVKEMALNVQVNTNYVNVGINETTIKYVPHYYDVVAGSINPVTNNTIEVFFPRFTIIENGYLGTTMAIKEVEAENRFNRLNNGLYVLSNIYKLDVSRGLRSVNLLNSPELKFNGYAINQAGIYKWENSKWKYVPTTINLKDNYLLTNIPSGEYRDTQYVVMVDTAYKMPNDIAYNWAFDEINASIRRWHVPYSPKFRPNDKITRGEMADILYRTLSYRNNYNKEVTVPSDVQDRYQIVEGVKYCLKRGLMGTFDDGNFKPDVFVSYDEFNTLMNKLKGGTFDIEAFQKHIQENKFYNFNYKGNNPYISRSEFVYAVYKILD